MKALVAVFVVFAAPLCGWGALAQAVLPFERAGGFVPANPVDKHVLATLRKQGIEPANPCSD
ncbi:MAG: hypothetical protein KKB50_00295, partial [Planctomycetes bacterium]|nr:hypothetical protein [Planctomycetota bacterium]